MARSKDGPRGRAPKQVRVGANKKVCTFCEEQAAWVDHKDTNLLRRFLSDRGKIRPQRVTGTCAHHQRLVALAIKTAREVALLPYPPRIVNERGPGRGRGASAGRSPTAPDAAASAETVATDDGGAEIEAGTSRDLVASGAEA